MIIDFDNTTSLDNSLRFGERRALLNKLNEGDIVIYDATDKGSEDKPILILARVIEVGGNGSFQVQDMKALGVLEEGVKLYDDEFGIKVTFNDVEFVVNDLELFMNSNAEYFI